MTILESGSDALTRFIRLIEDFQPNRDALAVGGTITELGQGSCRVVGLREFASIQDVLIERGATTPCAEVLHVSSDAALAALYQTDASLKIGTRLLRRGPLSIAPDSNWLGRVVNALGAPIDGRSDLARGPIDRAIAASAPPALARRVLSQGVSTGVKAIDLFTPLCVGQRLGIFAGSGVGKSTLLGMLATAVHFKVIVVGLVGERGREVREFIELIPEARRNNMIVVVSTGDESALLRRMAARTAMTVAEHFRDQGASVLLILDSVTRFALACREIAIASGEPPVSRGFPPSVFADLPRLLERAGPGPAGAGDITAIFSVLIDGDDHNDPIADAVRGIVDGHIVLDRAVAAQGRYPAINIPMSVSRLTHVALSADRQAFASRLRGLVARFEESHDLRQMGGYQPGVDLELDAAVAIVPPLYAALNQSGSDPACPDAFRDVSEALKRLSTGVEPSVR